jgi:short-subunit dehydrogenase
VAEREVVAVTGASGGISRGGDRAAFGPIDIWVNNAMTTVFDFFDDISADEYVRATRVTAFVVRR